MNQTYFYGILKPNHPDWERESCLEKNMYRPDAKYILIEKVCFDNGTEQINNIVCGNDLSKLIERLHTYISYYDYISGEKKNIQGYKSELNC